MALISHSQSEGLMDFYEPCLPLADERFAQDRISYVFSELARIIGGKISPEHLRDINFLFQARQDSICGLVDETTRECTAEALKTFRANPRSGEIESFFEEMAPHFGQIFSAIFEFDPDNEFSKIRSALSKNPNSRYLLNKASDAIAYRYFGELCTKVALEHGNLIEIIPGDDPFEVCKSIGTYLAELALLLVTPVPQKELDLIA